MLRMSLMGLGELSPVDAALWWLAPGPRDSWPVVVSAIALPSGDVRNDDTRQLTYWSKPFYDSVVAGLAAIGRSLSTQAPPDKSAVAPDVLPLFAALGKAADVRTAIQLAVANPLKPTVPVPAPAPAPTPAPPVTATPSTSAPAPAATPATQVTPASAATAIVQSGTPAAPVVPAADPAMQYSATAPITAPSSTLRWVLLGVLALGGAGAGTYYFIKKRKAAK